MPKIDLISVSLTQGSAERWDFTADTWPRRGDCYINTQRFKLSFPAFEQAPHGALADTFCCFWKGLEIPVKWCLCLLPKHELLVFPLIPSLITSIIIINYIEMFFLGLTSASDVHKYSCSWYTWVNVCLSLQGREGLVQSFILWEPREGQLAGSQLSFLFEMSNMWKRNPPKETE